MTDGRAGDGAFALPPAVPAVAAGCRARGLACAASRGLRLRRGGGAEGDGAQLRVTRDFGHTALGSHR